LITFLGNTVAWLGVRARQSEGVRKIGVLMARTADDAEEAIRGASNRTTTESDVNKD
jgi:hypothetical protein